MSDDLDFYELNDELLDEDELDSKENGFMEGYNKALEDDEGDE